MDVSILDAEVMPDVGRLDLYSEAQLKELLDLAAYQADVARRLFYGIFEGEE